jgi:hypothetical protein
MKQRDMASLVLGGWPRQDSRGIWCSSMFEGGGIGDRLRVEAAVLLYRASPQLIVVSGGKGKLAHLPDAPACASVLRRELLELGIPPDDIFEETQAANTYEQLQSIKNLFADFRITSLRIVSNRYHLPRIDAFLNSDSELHAWEARRRIQSQGAEDILLQHDPSRWHYLITEAYNSPTMKQRIADEAKGVRDILAGAYIR